MSRPSSISSTPRVPPSARVSTSCNTKLIHDPPAGNGPAGHIAPSAHPQSLDTPKDVINPLLGVVIGGVDFSNIFVSLNGQTYETLDAAQKAGAPTLNIGLFLNAII